MGLDWVGVVDTGEHRRAFQAHRRCRQRLRSGVGTRRIATALLLSAHPWQPWTLFAFSHSVLRTAHGPRFADKETGV